MESLGRVRILGDSYSTFAGWIPQDYAAFYGPGIGSVDAVEKTWWHRLLRETGSELLRNGSYSGTTVCNTGYDGCYCPDTSFVGRVQRDLAEPEGPTDTVLVFGGTNDSWAGSPVGEPCYEGWSEEALRSFAPAFCYLLAYLGTHEPEARVAVLINTELRPEIAEAMAEIGQHYGAEVVRLQDIEKTEGHPTARGMEQIKDQVLEALGREAE